MAQNYVLLERIELNQSASSVTFSSIPQTGYTDLKIVMSARSDNADDYFGLTFNGSSSSFTSRSIQGNGSSASSATRSDNYFVGTVVQSTLTASTFSNNEIYIPNYTSSNNKSFSFDAVQENNATSALSELFAGLWSNTAAITSIGFVKASGNFTANSTFSLYGIANASTTPAIAPKADGGNVIATDGTYWYHAFLSNGTFTPQVGLSADVLVVAGGGGGGQRGGGGGGAGGVLGFASQSLTATGYTCTIGAGGAGSTSSSVAGTNGVNSQFGSITPASVGGGGGAGTGSSANNGGSGGGAGYNTTTAFGTATSGQGYNGGQGNASGFGGGGGGAGAVGVNATSTTGGNGGIGVNTYTNATWLSTALSTTGLGSSGYIAGGGGGSRYGTNGSSVGTGGTGGGGNGGSVAVGGNGVVNTGSGGGGGGVDPAGSPEYAGGSGGAGLIIIRYAVA